MNELLALLKGVIASNIADEHKVKIADTVVDVLGLLAADLVPAKVATVAAVIGEVAQSITHPAA